MAREYPERPLVGVGGVVFDGGRVLLVKRGSQPSYGKWSIPGGLVELGETVADACVREVYEETGLIVKVKRLIDVVDYIDYDEEGEVRFHYVIVDFLVEPVGGVLRAGTDALDARFVRLDDLGRYELTGTARRLFIKLGWMKG
nr:NUDIX hydrolase [Candidatus Freyrarchaeum guaymaensis]